MSNTKYGLEVQEPWGKLLLDGSKAVETRSWEFPEELLGCELEVIETPEGLAGKSSLEDEVKAGVARLIGRIIVIECIKYQSLEEWRADEDRHLVTADSPYDWQSDTTSKWGWVVQPKERYEEPRPTPQMYRKLRSLFQLQQQ
eukprot:TRINITY_DN19754_c1_g1_i2.p1 TRINITY_DN19754_c1_g1~~TRINITY_DN19754_c1_g1_i2.p1  ORF type:complete len:143 (+),score=33.81 TRINITY_DN19754_c1_g1_i2:22-450(+)